jgi:hypothetical protein
MTAGQGELTQSLQSGGAKGSEARGGGPPPVEGTAGGLVVVGVAGPDGLHNRRGLVVGEQQESAGQQAISQGAGQ